MRYPICAAFVCAALLPRAAFAQADFIQTGKGAESIAWQCYRPHAADPQSMIDACTRVIDDTSLADEPWPYAQRAGAYMRLGKFVSALADADTAISHAGKNDKNLPVYYGVRCLARLDSHKAQDAVADCTTSLALRPNDMGTLDLRGDAEYELRDYAAAIVDFGAVLSLDPKQAGSLYVRGLARIRTGDAAGGNADIAAAKTMNPDIARDYPGFDKQ
jgi:tetratricopeptide (TPR) repeat protein